MASKARMQFEKRLQFMVNSDNEILDNMPTDSEIAEFFDTASELENVHNSCRMSDAANWFTLQEINDFLADY